MNPGSNPGSPAAKYHAHAGAIASVCQTLYSCCMTMLSFRVTDADAEELQRWTESLGVDRSELLREALHRQLTRLRSEADAEAVERVPVTESEMALAEVADWGPAEDWDDWRDAAR